VFDLDVDGNHNFVANGILVHNCHRIGSATWSRVPPLFPARWWLGLSATPRRKDGADAVFHHHIGEVIFASTEVRMKPKVRKVWITPDLFKIVHAPNFNSSLIKKGLLLRFMCVSAGRNRAITEQVLLAVRAGRKCLVVSERLQHLQDLETALYKQWGDAGAKPSVGFYIGGQTQEALDVASKAQVIFATSQLVQEGLDIPPLDTLFLTCPMGDVEQIAGRILRPFEGKKDPVVVDFRDDHINLCKKSGEYRDKFYKKQGWVP
jgi:superfamily II DNA or RNA helicase